MSRRNSWTPEIEIVEADDNEDHDEAENLLNEDEIKGGVGAVDTPPRARAFSAPLLCNVLHNGISRKRSEGRRRPSLHHTSISGIAGKVRTIIISVSIFFSAAALIIGLLSIIHVSILRHSASRSLGRILRIFESAEYYPIINEYYSERHDMRERYARMLSSFYDARRLSMEEKEQERKGKRLVLPAASLATAIVAPIHGKPVPTDINNRPIQLCSVTYSMNITAKEAKSMDLDDYDQELLGTIMVRLLHCNCGGTAHPPQNDSMKLMSEILRGAHVVVEGDKGAFYSWFTQMQDSYMRTSSHNSIVPMYGVPEGSVLRTILTGREVGGSSWFQFEGAMWDPLRRPSESFIHAVNYIQYKMTGRQVGPLGVSNHTDSKPIRLTFDGCRDRRGLLFRQYDADDPIGKSQSNQPLQAMTASLLISTRQMVSKLIPKTTTDVATNGLRLRSGGSTGSGGGREGSGRMRMTGPEKDSLVVPMVAEATTSPEGSSGPAGLRAMGRVAKAGMTRWWRGGEGEEH